MLLSAFWRQVHGGRPVGPGGRCPQGAVHPNPTFVGPTLQDGVPRDSGHVGRRAGIAMPRPISAPIRQASLYCIACMHVCDRSRSVHILSILGTDNGCGRCLSHSFRPRLDIPRQYHLPVGGFGATPGEDKPGRCRQLAFPDPVGCQPGDTAARTYVAPHAEPCPLLFVRNYRYHIWHGRRAAGNAARHRSGNSHVFPTFIRSRFICLRRSKAVRSPSSKLRAIAELGSGRGNAGAPRACEGRDRGVRVLQESAAQD